MHILIESGVIGIPLPILIIAFLPPYFASCFSRRTLSIPTTSHILVSATYNHLGSFHIATANVWYPRFHAHLCRADVPTNLFFMENRYLSLIAKPVREIASRLGVEFETPDE
jgi:hypothetical protein